jgi:hypothetical protein
VAEVLSRVEGSVALRQHHRDRVAEELGAVDAPLARVAADQEHALARANEELLSHYYPPESAWTIYIWLSF